MKDNEKNFVWALGITIALITVFAFFTSFFSIKLPKELSVALIFAMLTVCISAHIAIKGNSAVKLASTLVFLCGTVFLERKLAAAIINKLYDFSLYLLRLPYVKAILYSVLTALFFMIIIKYFKLYDRIHSQKRFRYFIFAAAGGSLALILHETALNSVGLIRLLAVLLPLSLLLAAMFNENLSSARKHPYLFAFVGLGVSTLCCIYAVQTKIISGYNENALSLWAIIFGLWLIVDFAVTAAADMRTRFLGIAAETALAAVVIGSQLCAKTSVSNKKIVFITIIAFFLTCLAELPIFLAAKKKLHYCIKVVWNKYLRKNIYIAAGCAVILIWLIIFVTVCIVRWSIFDSRDSFVSALAECGAYLMLALLFITAVSIAAITIVYLLCKICGKNPNAFEGKDITFLIGFCAIFTLMACMYAGEGRLEGVIKNLGRLDGNTEASVQIIMQIFPMIFVPFIAGLLISQTLSASAVKWCKIFINNRAFTELICGYISGEGGIKGYLTGVLPRLNFDVQTLCAYKKGENPALTEEQTVAAKMLLCSKHINKLLNRADDLPSSFFPNSLSAFFALYAVSFAFKILDIAEFTISKIIDSFSDDGIIMGAINDLLYLFTGRNH